MYGSLRKGIDLRHPHLTRSPRRWLGYVSWWAAFNLQQWFARPPGWMFAAARRILPKRVAFCHGGSDSLFFGPRRATGRHDEPNEALGAAILHFLWFARLKRAWLRCVRFACRFHGKYGSRADWTDRTNGRLYGGDGGTIERLFEQMVEDISPTAEQMRHVQEAVDGLVVHIHQHGQDIN